MAKQNMKPQKRIDTVPGTPASIRASRVTVRGKVRTTTVPPAPKKPEIDDEDERITIPVPRPQGAATAATTESQERLAAVSERVEPRGSKHDPRRED